MSCRGFQCSSFRLDADLGEGGELEVESVEEGVVTEGEVTVGEGGEAGVVVDERGTVEAAFLPLVEVEGVVAGGGDGGEGWVVGGVEEEAVFGEEGGEGEVSE